MISARNPAAVFAVFWIHRHLVFQLARRDVQARYRGSTMGLVWSLASPILMLAVYTFVFSTVFEARWDVQVGGRADFALMLFAGLIVFWLFADCLNRAPGLMFENVSYIKKVVFPLEILPGVVLLSGLFHAAISLLVLIAAQVTLVGLPSTTALLVPVILLPIILLTMGFSWLLASLGVYLRDLRQVVPVLTLMLLFLSPIFYPVSAVPEEFRTALGMNPIALTIGDFRNALFNAQVPNWGLFLGWTASAWLFAWFGFAWFKRARGGFADVI